MSMNVYQKFVCSICPHACALAEGELGLCHARVCKQGVVQPIQRGMYSVLHLDPIEKKPLKHFQPGTKILSIGGYGCNMRCWFCQNHEIALEDLPERGKYITSEQLVECAVATKAEGNIGIAYTYNEPGIAYEFVRDTSELAVMEGLKNVLVTNGFMHEGPWRRLMHNISACNIDLKCFTREGYVKLFGDLDFVRRNIAIATEYTHVEITTLIVPGFSDEALDMDAQARWLSTLSPNIPLHITRYFPNHEADMPETDILTLYSLRAIAKQYLNNVYVGNV